MSRCSAISFERCPCRTRCATWISAGVSRKCGLPPLDAEGQVAHGVDRAEAMGELADFDHADSVQEPMDQRRAIAPQVNPAPKVEVITMSPFFNLPSSWAMARLDGIVAAVVLP